MDSGALRAWLRLARTPGVGGAAAQRLLAAFPTLASALDAGSRNWRVAGLSEAQVDALQRPDEDGIAQDLDWLAVPGRTLLTLEDPRYPEQLREIAVAPPVLFVQGDAELLTLPQLAIVGSRQCSPQGLENAQAFAAELSRRGLVITSGLALGIDGAAHRGALAADGFSIAICATGLDRVYPARHKTLAHQLATRGALVSEFPVGVQALAENFPRRNRIISGLSLGVLVVEAARESGSLITARLALEQGREVFAIPGSIHNPMARGCHALIRQGAKLVETVDDVLEELGPLLAAHPSRRASRREATASPRAAASPAGATAPDPVAVEILRVLGDDALPLEQIAAGVQRPVAELQAALTRLELTDRIAAAPGGRYQRIYRA